MCRAEEGKRNQKERVYNFFIIIYIISIAIAATAALS